MIHNTIIKFVNCKLNKSICGNGCYIGKTERYLITRITEHDMKETEPMFQHLSLSLSPSLSLSLCKLFKDYFWLYSISSLFNQHEDSSLTSHIFNAILQNHEILDGNSNWSQLRFL